MISLNEIKAHYPNTSGQEKNVLKEYLQYKILEIIFSQKISSKLSFLGGTAIKICYGSSRFSEDLDFDNFGLSEEEFNDLAEKVKKELSLLGYKIEIKNVFKGAFRCYIRIPKILFDNDLSPLEEEKIVIQLDTVSHNFKYEPEKILLQKFDVYTNISVTPKDILLSQKAETILNRKRAKGRDFYDFSYLMGIADFNWEYLSYKLGVKNKSDLKKKLLSRLEDINLENLTKDVEPFLLKAKDKERILTFGEYIEQKL